MMKKLLSPIFLILLLGFFVSCSEEAEPSLSADEIIGVCEQEGFMDTSGWRLVFFPDHVSLKIFRVTDGEFITSSSRNYHWEINNNEVLISEDSEVVDTYTLSVEGQLISDDPEEIPFDKISDTTLNY